MKPQTVTIPRPTGGDRVAVVVTSYEVDALCVYVDGEPDTCEYTLGMDVVTDIDSNPTYKREFWISADALNRADTVHVDTRDPYLETLNLEVQYRGRIWRLVKPVHDALHTHRERKPITNGSR